MWVAYARTVLGQSMAHPTRGEPLNERLVEQFEGLLDEWEATAQLGTEFVWTQSLDANTIELLAQSFFAIVSVLSDAAEDRGFPISPPEGDEFYWALVNTMLDALTEQGGAHAEAAEYLRAHWPGRKDD